MPGRPRIRLLVDALVLVPSSLEYDTHSAAIATNTVYMSKFVNCSNEMMHA